MPAQHILQPPSYNLYTHGLYGQRHRVLKERVWLWVGGMQPDMYVIAGSSKVPTWQDMLRAAGLLQKQSVVGMRPGHNTMHPTSSRACPPA